MTHRWQSDVLFVSLVVAMVRQQRAHSGLRDIQVLDQNWNVVETITNEDLKPVV